MIAIYVILGIVVLIIMWLIATYNKLVRAANKVDDEWAQIDVQLKKRFDLIPNLVETVKGYAKHESDTLEAVINARNKAVSATTPEDEIKANGELTGALNRLFALTEAYPDLKANTSFIDLQTSLKDVEEKIAYARQFYNDSVMMYKNMIRVFPTVLVAGLLGFKEKAFFEANANERENVKVDFNTNK